MTDCDLQTDLYDPSFSCKTLGIKAKKLYTDSIVLGYRNSLIAEAVLKSNNNKIVLIYGKGHFEGIKELLENK